MLFKLIYKPFGLVAGSEPVMRVFDMTRMRERLPFVAPPEAER